jgi:hypothetical protein
MSRLQLSGYRVLVLLLLLIVLVLLSVVHLFGLLHFSVRFGELQAQCLRQIRIESNTGQLLLGILGIVSRCERHESNRLFSLLIKMNE